MSEHHGRPVWSELPPIVRRIVWILVAVSAVSVLVEFLPYHKHGHYPIETSFGFHAWYGFVCCFMLVIVAAQMRKVLMRPEDYYDDEDSEPGPGNGEDA